MRKYSAAPTIRPVLGSRARTWISGATSLRFRPPQSFHSLAAPRSVVGPFNLDFYAAFRTTYGYDHFAPRIALFNLLQRL